MIAARIKKEVRSRNRSAPHGVVRRARSTDAMSVGLFLVRRACSTASGCKSRPNLMEVKGSEAQGRHREVRSEGSVEQRYGPMDKNWIGGLRRRTSGQLIAKSEWQSPCGERRLEPPALPRVQSYGTAVCGPACTVVWQGRRGDSPPYADLLKD